MRPLATFVGTISKDAEVIAPPNGKKPFVGMTLESGDDYSKFPIRLKVVYYGKDNHGAAARWRQGMVMFVQGDISAEAYVSSKTGKPTGVLKMFAKTVEIISEAPATATAPAQPPMQPAPQAYSRPAVAPAPGQDQDDVPF